MIQLQEGFIAIKLGNSQWYVNWNITIDSKSSPYMVLSAYLFLHQLNGAISNCMFDPILSELSWLKLLNIISEINISIFINIYYIPGSSGSRPTQEHVSACWQTVLSHEHILRPLGSPQAHLMTVGWLHTWQCALTDEVGGLWRTPASGEGLLSASMPQQHPRCNAKYTSW